jgi:phytoene dehydrogenase-like protein
MVQPDLVHGAVCAGGLPDRRDWDVVCVGSGVGSLAAAATLARAGRSVLVLEAHDEVGGLTHTFARRARRWATGLHYTGWPTSYCCDFPELWDILTDGRAPWRRLPDEADVYMRPDGVFVRRGPRGHYRDDLLAAFPDERRAIDRYLDDMRRILADYLRFMTLQAVPPLLERLGLGWWLGRRFLRMDRLPLERYMDGLGASRRLREHLWFTWGNFDGRPERTSVGAYAVPMEFMMDGLWTAREGPRSVASAFVRALRASGGEIRRRARVTGLVFAGGRAVGVRVGDDEVRARTLVSGIGARETYQLLVPPERRPAHAARVLALPSTASIMTLYLMLDPRLLERHGLHAVNYWVEAEPGALYGYWNDLSKPPPWFVLSLAARFQEGEAGGAGDDGIQAELFLPVPGEHFARWQGTRTMRRGPDYDDFKTVLAELALDRAEQTWPGFRQAVRDREASTPLTIESYTGHPGGAAYGIAPVPGRYSERALRCLSGVPGLVLAGQDVAAGGVIGAFYGGLAAASAVLRRDAASLVLRGGRAVGEPVGFHGLQR